MIEAAQPQSAPISCDPWTLIHILITAPLAIACCSAHSSPDKWRRLSSAGPALRAPATIQECPAEGYGHSPGIIFQWCGLGRKPVEAAKHGTGVDQEASEVHFKVLTHFHSSPGLLMLAVALTLNMVEGGLGQISWIEM